MRFAFFLRLVAAMILSIGVIFTTCADAAQKKSPTSGKDAAFSKFVEQLWPDAKARGVSRETFDQAFKGIRFNPKVVPFTTAQAEFVKPVWGYLATAVTGSRIERGKERAEKEQRWLDKAVSTYGVEPAVIMGIWGMETEFGAFMGSDNVIRSLASLAFVKFRGDYFRDELIAALTIIENGDVEAKSMVGSWAGAMGQTQFMPSSFLEYAVDFDGQGRRDIWSNRADAIGSTANYLAKHGWKPGQRWGYEVRLPEGFDLTAADSETDVPLANFAKRGVRRADGASLPENIDGHLLILAGLRGPIFLVTPNFQVIKTYNNSTSYALGVALLGDAIVGRQELQASWPRDDKPVSTTQIRELQTRLKKRGYEVGEVDGRAGESLRRAVRAYQADEGLAPDGYVTPSLFKRLKDKR